MHRLERSHLVLIREMERRGTLTAAAKSLGLSQSALSHTLRLLEEAFGTEIFVRQGRGLRRTPAGDHILALAERLLPQFEHAEIALDQFASGGRGQIRIGMECHPCYRWLLNVVAPYLRAFPDVDVDVKQRFQFGGIGALFSHEIDVLVTPDPLKQKGLSYEPVFDYELRLVVAKNHRLARNRQVDPNDLRSETLITYPVEIQRLDIYSQFLLPAGVLPKTHKTIETTDIMLQMVEGGRGVTALPGWLLREYRGRLAIQSLRLGKRGIKKQIFLGVRARDEEQKHIAAFIKLAKRAKVSGRPSA